MKLFLSAMALAVALPASAQQFASAGDYRTCSPAQTNAGLEAVRQACGTLTKPVISAQFGSYDELQAALAQRTTFRQQVDDYGDCVTEFINSFRRPGADANSTKPDEAACAHAWAQDAVTQTVMEVGRACIDYADRSMMSSDLVTYDGACYPDFGSDRG